MIQLIKFELKKMLKSRKNRIIFVIYCVLILAFVFSKMDASANLKLETLKNSIFLDDYYKLDTATYKNRAERFDAPLFHMYSNNAAVRSAYYNKKAELIRNGDVWAELNADIAHFESEIHFYRDDIQVLYDSGTLLKGLPSRYMDFPFRLLFAVQARENLLDYLELQRDFLTSLRDSEIRPMSQHEMTGFGFLYSVMDELLPPLALLLSLLMLSDVVSGEGDTGSFKFLLLQPIKRNKVLFSKMVASFVTILTILILPLLLVFLVLGTINGFGSAEYPVLYLDTSFSSLTAPPAAPNADNAYLGRGFYRFVSWERDTAFLGMEYMQGNFYLGISKYASPNGNFLLFGLPGEDLRLIPIGLFLLYSLIPLALYMIFTSSLALFLSTLSRSNRISIVVCALVGALFAIISVPPESIDLVSALIPLAYKNPVTLLSGLNATPALLGIVVMSAFSIMLQTLSAIIFNKRDIIC